MSPALVQALQRLVVIFIVGGLVSVGANLTILDGALGSLGVVLIPLFTAGIDAILKLLGGATIPASRSLPADAYFSKQASTFDWPHFWSV